MTRVHDGVCVFCEDILRAVFINLFPSKGFAMEKIQLG